jgi:hypothetical protein
MTEKPRARKPILNDIMVAVLTRSVIVRRNRNAAEAAESIIRKS